MDLESIQLEKLSHPKGGGYCVMELCAAVAGEYHTDKPVSVDPLIADIARTINDWADDQRRQDLKNYVEAMCETAFDHKHTQRIRDVEAQLIASGESLSDSRSIAPAEPEYELALSDQLAASVLDKHENHYYNAAEELFSLLDHWLAPEPVPA